MSYEDKAEQTREFYRRQGENRERQRILALLEMLENYRDDATWSPTYIKSLIERNENRIAV